MGFKNIDFKNGCATPVPPGPAVSAEKLSKFYTAGETISALKLVYLGASETIFIGNPAAFSTSLVLGIALTAGNIGDSIEVQMFGLVSDAGLSFLINEYLYLSATGSLTNIVPIVGHRVVTGKGLGAGAIFLKIEEPIVL